MICRTSFKTEGCKKSNSQKVKSGYVNFILTFFNLNNKNAMTKKCPTAYFKIKQWTQSLR